MWTTGHRAHNLFGQQAVDLGVEAVTFNIWGQDLSFPGEGQPRNLSAWIDGAASNKVIFTDKDGAPLDLWDRLGCSIRALILPAAEDEVLVYMCFVPVGLDELRAACAARNTDLEGADMPMLVLPVMNALSKRVPLIPQEQLESATGLAVLPRLVYRGIGNLPAFSRETLLWEQRNLLRSINMNKFVGVDDWLKLFPKETWPQSTSRPEMIWPEPTQQAAADERGIMIKPNCMKPTNNNTCWHSLILV